MLHRFSSLLNRSNRNYESKLVKSEWTEGKKVWIYERAAERLFQGSQLMQWPSELPVQSSQIGAQVHTHEHTHRVNMWKVNNLIGLQEHLDEMPERQQLAAALTPRIQMLVPVRNTCETPLNDLLSQNWQQGIMGVVCYLPGVCCAACTWHLTPQTTTSLQVHQSLWLLCQDQLNVFVLLVYSKEQGRGWDVVRGWSVSPFLQWTHAEIQ